MIDQLDVAGQGIAAYKREREGVVRKLAELRRLDPETQYIVHASTPLAPPPGLELGPKLKDVVAGFERTLAEIDATIARLEGSA